MTFETAVAFVLKWEGEISDDPNDPGRLTKWGISSVSCPQVSDSAFSRYDAIQIYRTDFWDRFRCSEMPNGVDLMALDCAINQTQQAGRLIQAAAKVKQDGIIGPVTLEALKQLPAADMITEIAARRAVAYAENPLERDRLGWFRRLCDCMRVAVIGS
jgi:lysozyme family protein